MNAGSFNDNDLELLEFIPEDEDENNWSKIITTNLFLGKSVKADGFVQYMKETIVKIAKDSKILEENKTQADSFETATTTIAYTYNGHREVMRVIAYSGPLDCTSIQYTAVVKENQSDDNAFQKQKVWMEDTKNIQIIKF